MLAKANSILYPLSAGQWGISHAQTQKRKAILYTQESPPLALVSTEKLVPARNFSQV